VRAAGRSGLAASRVSGSSKKSNSMSASRSVMAPLQGKRHCNSSAGPKRTWGLRRRNLARVSQAAVAVAPQELVLGRYRPLQPLGSGGSGSVWLARDEPTGVEVALKIVPREGKAAVRAEREATAAARLRHRGCQRAYALARDSRHVYIAYEYVPGRTLRQALRDGALDDGTAVEAAAQICEALAYAHAHGIVHRDVKPSNVLVADGDELSVRLLDFGLARMDGEETITAAGDVPGTLAYIAPERLRGDESGAAADVWAVGVLLWEALAGWHPFWKGSLLDTARRIEDGAETLARARPDLPRPFVALVDRALSLDPEQRPSAAKLAAGLRATYRTRERRRAKASFAPPPLERLVPAAGAGLLAGVSTALFPFFPTGWPLGLAAIAAAVSLARERAGLAFALAAPVLPLGNVAAGLAWLYAGLALAWLCLSWRDPRRGLVFVSGALLGPLSLLPLLPLAVQTVRGAVRRAAHATAAVGVAAVGAGARGDALPLTSHALRRSLPLGESSDPLAVAGTLWRAVASHPPLALETLVLALAAVAAPYARRRGSRGLAVFTVTLLAAIVLPQPSLPTLPLVLAVAALPLGLAAGSRR
jgi:hypothetical protein